LERLTNSKKEKWKMPLDELAGAAKAKDVVEREPTVLEELLRIGEEIVGKYVGINANLTSMEINDHYVRMHDELVDTLPNYTADDIQEWVLSQTNTELNKQKSIARGLFSGNLVHILTERNREKGEKTTIHVDGDERRFDYLFYFTKHADHISVKNFKGNNILTYAASHKGNIKNITLHNIHGGGAGSNAGNNQGSVGTMLVTNVEGDCAGSHAGGDYGSVGTMLVTNVEGDFTGYYAGNDYGNVGTMIINKAKGDYVGVQAGSDHGSVETMLVTNVQGDRAGSEAGQNHGNVETMIINKANGYCAGSHAGQNHGNVETILVTNIQGDWAGSHAGQNHGNVETMLITNVEGREVGSEADAGILIAGPQAHAELQKPKYQHLRRMLELADSMKDKTGPELLPIVEQIGQLGEQYR
jgi:hypothetical protein